MFAGGSASIQRILVPSFALRIAALLFVLLTRAAFRNLTRVLFFILFKASSIPSDFDWTRCTSFVEIVKVSRDTMNYSCRGDAKLRETFLATTWAGSVCALRTAARVYRCLIEVHAYVERPSGSSKTKGYEGPDRGMNAGKRRIIGRRGVELREDERKGWGKGRILEDELKSNSEGRSGKCNKF